MDTKQLVELLRQIAALTIREVQGFRKSDEMAKVLLQKALEDVSSEELRRAILSYGHKQPT